MYRYIHGAFYDLTPFIASHPGGTTILHMSRGMADATPVMESYHAFANKEYIAKTLAKYKIDYTPKDAETREKTETTYTFDENGFYATLTRRVRAHFGSTKENESITRNIKANYWWTFKVATQTVMYLALYAVAFVVPGVPTIVSILSAALAGMMIIAVGMNAMHDGSHYAIGARDSWKNKLAMRIWNAAAYWDPAEWLFHHTIRHHAYTGDSVLDPGEFLWAQCSASTGPTTNLFQTDTLHANPAVRKHLETPRSMFFESFPRILAVERWFWAIWSAIIYVFFPGMFTMQIFTYKFAWPFVGSLWNMPYEKTKGVFEKYWWEYAITLSMFAAHVYKFNPFVSIAFFMAANLTYALCIVPDHDTYDSAILNHVSGDRVDWGEIQVRHASDFGGLGVLGRAFTEMFGSINVQIAHHLYPSVNHIYLPEIQPIIKQTCAEFNIPYAHQKTMLEAAWSFIKTVHRCMAPDEIFEADHQVKKVQ